MVNAIGPGKAAIASYLFGQKARAGHGFWIGVKLIATHVGSAVVLVLAAVTILEIRFGLRPADFPAVRLISYFGVAAVGAYLLASSLYRPVARHDEPRAGVLPYLAGLSPCPLTIIIMTAAVSTGALYLGLLVSLSMALGMVVTLAALSFMVIFVRRSLLAAFQRNKRQVVRASQALEVTGACAVLMVGVLLFATELVSA